MLLTIAIALSVLFVVNALGLGQFGIFVAAVIFFLAHFIMKPENRP